MKKLKPLLKITILSLFLISLFAGCSNLDDSKDDSENGPESALTDSSKGKLQISLGSAGARYIAAYNFVLSNFADWEMTLVDENDTDAEEITLSNDSSDSSTTSSASLSYSTTTETLTASNIPAGKYTVTITGTYTPTSSDGTSTSTTYTVSGSKSGVVIAQGKAASADIFVGMDTTSEGSGYLSLTLTDTSKIISSSVSGTPYIGDFNIKLSSLTNSAFCYETDENTLLANSTKTSYTFTLTGGGEDTDSDSYGKISSGWYMLSVSLDGYKTTLSDSIIEIADDVTTTGTISLSVSTSKTYYATNDISATDKNGLSTLSRINLTTLLGNLATNIPDEGEIDIYVNGTPEIDLDAFANLKSILSEGNEDGEQIEKSIYIYNANVSTETAAISLDLQESTTLTTGDTGGSSGGASEKEYTTSISGALTLTKGTETTTLDVGTITVDSNSSYTITLKGGAAMNITGDISNTLSGTLGICAVVSTGSTTSDNFSAYTSTPFLTTTSSVSSNLKLYDSEGNTASYSANETETSGTYTYTAKEA